MSFFDTIRLFSFFLKRAAEEQSASSQTVVAGFLEAGTPCIASVIVMPGFNRAAFCKCSRGGTVAIPVGNPTAGRLLLESMAQAKQEKRPTIASALGTLFYIAKLDGSFGSIGGGLSVATCTVAAESVSWPIVEIHGNRFLRGMDVTKFHRPTWPVPEVIPYDEAWCAALDKRVASAPSVDPAAAEEALPGFDIDLITNPETLFASHTEPEALR